MRKIQKALVIILSLTMIIGLFGIPAETAHAAETKEGVYGVEGFYIKNISKSGNKLKVITYKSKQLSTARDEHIVFLSGKTHTFVLDKNVKYWMEYYLSGNVKKSSLKKIQKAIKISKKNKDIYEYAFETDNYDLESEDYPRLYIIVNEKGKVTDIQYNEGGFDILDYEE